MKDYSNDTLEALVKSNQELQDKINEIEVLLVATVEKNL